MVINVLGWLKSPKVEVWLSFRRRWGQVELTPGAHFVPLACFLFLSLHEGSSVSMSL